MTRHLASVDTAMKRGLEREIAAVMAEHIISGHTIHNVETGELVMADRASDEFRAEAIAAYARMIVGGGVL